MRQHEIAALACRVTGLIVLAWALTYLVPALSTIAASAVNLMMSGSGR
ncbi:MAG: hypothetical protein ACM3U2_09300 [Deltaproteobacteria bacterium]